MSIVNAQFGTSSPRIAHLRELLAEKFPGLPLKAAGSLQTGWAPLDEAGGLRRGAVTEFTGSLGSGGLFIEIMLEFLQKEQCLGALVDACGGFDPAGSASGALPRLLCVMCTDVKQSMRVTDLLLRDANLSIVLLDLRMADCRQWRGFPSSTWHRFRQLVEQADTAFVILTSRPMVEAAHVRIAARSHWTLDTLRERRTSLAARMEANVFERRHFSELPGRQQQFA